MVDSLRALRCLVVENDSSGTASPPPLPLGMMRLPRGVERAVLPSIWLASDEGARMRAAADEEGVDVVWYEGAVPFQELNELFLS